MSATPKNDAQNRKPPVSLRVPLSGACIAALLTLGISLEMPTKSSPDALPRESSPSVALQGELPDPAIARRVERARFYDQDVIPLIEQLDRENRDSAKRCLMRLDQTINGYHDGVERFVKDMTSFRTRMGILKRMPGGWWSKDGRVESYVQQKFETHLFSEQQLADDISNLLIDFRGEIQANQISMLTKVQAALSTADLPHVELGDHDEFFRELSAELNRYASDQGVTSVENMVGVFVLSEVGAFAARSVVAGLLARFAPSVAISSAAGASATVGASATGAGGGSLGGPVGAVVGFGAGLALGLVIDWWMTERFEAELSGQLHTYLNDLRETLVRGGSAESALPTPPSEPEPENRPGGLAGALPQVCGELFDAYRDHFFHKIVDGDAS